MDFEYDVFISYTHLDNRPLREEEEKGWISRFHYAFNRRLGQLLGRDAKIWFDEKLQKNDDFNDEITDCLHDAKVLLTVISPRYLKSEWCTKERELFKEAAKSNIGACIGNKSRIFKVIKTHVPYDQHPTEIQGTIGYEFCELDEKKIIHEFNPEKGSEYEKKYWKRFNEVAGDICNLINEMDQPNKGKKQQPENPPEKPYTWRKPLVISGMKGKISAASWYNTATRCSLLLPIFFKTKISRIRFATI